MPAEPLSEAQVRALLHRAADTVDVAPGGVPRPLPRRRWPLVAAAAAVAGLMVGTAILADRGAPGPDPAQPPAPETAEVVPSVFGLTVDEATATLEAAGLEVTVDGTRGTCETPLRAMGTRPEAGENVRGRVVLRVPKGTDAGFCVDSLENREEAWRFLDLLAGRPSTLAFADSVRLRVDGLPEQTLTAEQAADPTAWKAPAAVATLITSVEAPGTTMSTRFGTGETNAPRCGYPDPSDLDEREALTIALDTGVGTSLGDGCPIGIDLYRTGGAVDTIVVATASADVAETRMQDLVDLSEDEARAAIAALGTDTQVFVSYRESGCDASGLVAEQQPEAGAALTPQASVLLVVDVDTAGCGGPERPTAAQEELARALIGFADTDGSGPPPLADRVELFVGNIPIGIFTRAQLADPDAWNGCPGAATTYVGGSCLVNLLGGLQESAVNDSRVDVVTRPGPLPCGGGLLAPSLPGRSSLRPMIFLQPQQLTCANGYRLQLILDDQDRIAAANVIRTEP